MRNTLIIYSSVDGHTKEISKRIAEKIKDKSSVDLIPLSEANSLSLSNYEQIIIGASIRYGNYRRELFDFIDRNLEDIIKKDNAFFSVNVVARKEDKSTIELNPYIRKFLNSSKWQPNKIDVFAGVVDYPSYGFFDKFMIRLIMLITKGPTDVSERFEFTDWNRVDKFAENLY